MHADKPERGEAYCRCHVAHLAVLAFDEHEAHPAGGDVRTEADGRNPFPNPVWGFYNFCLAGLGAIALDVYAFAEFAYGIFCDLAVDLCQVGARVFEFRVQQFLDEFAVVCQ